MFRLFDRVILGILQLSSFALCLAHAVIFQPLIDQLQLVV